MAARGRENITRRTLETTNTHAASQFPRVSHESFARDRAFITLTMNTFLLRHLNRVYQEFGGDMCLAIVLGEIAHHNVTGIIATHGYDEAQLLSSIQSQRAQGGLLPTNAYSISQATGIPRETVRRKIAILVRKGWLKRAAGGYHLTGSVGEHFRDFNYGVLSELMEVANCIARRCATHPSGSN